METSPKRPVVAPKLRDPIVLVHGLLGADAVRLLGRPVAGYFRGIAETLTAAGNRVLAARLSPTDGVARRAAELRDFLRRDVPPGPVHVFAHSMGGLDARYLISRMDGADRVLSLTTIGTPHRGSPYADWGVTRLGRFVQPLLRLFATPDQAFFDLTTDGCRAFNAEVPDVPGVRYFAVAGRCSPAWLGLEWLHSHAVIRRAEGPNDGMVSVASATWGEHTDVWAGDHLSLINWPNPLACALGVWRSRNGQYAELVRRLAAAGF
jgi:triacylglycerol lipase